MSVDRHTSDSRTAIPILPHRSAPPSEEEIFGKPKKPSPIEVGLLQMQILWLLNRKSTHGYDIMETLNKIKSTKITQGTLYPTLKSLKKYGFVRRERVDDRIIYHITQDGRNTLNKASLDFTRTFFGIFQDYVCHKCLEHPDKHEVKK